MPPPSGYKTFNQFFARHAKPGTRPVAAIGDDAVLVAPADSRFVEWWQVGQKSKIYVEENKLIHQTTGSPRRQAPPSRSDSRVDSPALIPGIDPLKRPCR